jgi:hypothetical protein
MAVSGKRRAREAKKQRRLARERKEALKQAQQRFDNLWSVNTDTIADLEAFIKLIDEPSTIQPHQKEFFLSFSLPEGAVGADIYDHHNMKHTLEVIDDIENDPVSASTPQVGVDLPNTSSWTAVAQMTGKFVDMGINDTDGISGWHYAPLEKFPIPPDYAIPPEDVMLPDQDVIYELYEPVTLADLRGFSNVEL